MLTLPAVGSASSLFGASNVVLDNAAPVFPGDATTSNAPLVRTIATGSTTATVVYDADATDNGRAADTGITYTLSGTNAASFSLGAMTGILTPAMTLTGVATYSVTITATDESDNAAVFYIRVRVSALPFVTITDNIVAATANSADGNVTFTFSFSEDVTGFENGDVTVTGGNRVSLTPTPAATTTYTDAAMFTLVATPVDGVNTGSLTITVPVNAVTAVAGSGRQNVAASHTQNYDTLAPNVPFIDNLGRDGSNYFNAAERDAGFLITGLVDEPGLRVSVCILDEFPCIRNAAINGTFWLYPVTGDDARAMGEGFELLIATATDAAGNPSMITATDGFKVITVDTRPPDFFVLGFPPPGTDSRVVAVNTAISVIVYDAFGLDGEGAADEGINYTLSGPAADMFNI